eukprot:31265-Pelagococcus_subviridis.AAC.30
MQEHQRGDIDPDRGHGRVLRVSDRQDGHVHGVKDGEEVVLVQFRAPEFAARGADQTVTQHEHEHLQPTNKYPRFTAPTCHRVVPRRGVFRREEHRRDHERRELRGEHSSRAPRREQGDDGPDNLRARDVHVDPRPRVHRQRLVVREHRGVVAASFRRAFCLAFHRLLVLLLIVYLVEDVAQERGDRGDVRRVDHRGQQARDIPRRRARGRGVQLPPVTRAEEPPEIREEQLKRRRVVEALDRLEDRFERVRAGAGASLQRVELVRDVVVVDDEHANEFRTGRGAPGLQHLDGHEPGAAIHLVHGNIDPQPPFAAPFDVQRLAESHDRGNFHPARDQSHRLRPARQRRERARVHRDRVPAWDLVLVVVFLPPHSDLPRALRADGDDGRPYDAVARQRRRDVRRGRRLAREPAEIANRRVHGHHQTRAPGEHIARHVREEVIEIIVVDRPPLGRGGAAGEPARDGVVVEPQQTPRAPRVVHAEGVEAPVPGVLRLAPAERFSVVGHDVGDAFVPERALHRVLHERPHRHLRRVDRVRVHGELHLHAARGRHPAALVHGEVLLRAQGEARLDGRRLLRRADVRRRFLDDRLRDAARSGHRARARGGRLRFRLDPALERRPSSHASLARRELTRLADDAVREHVKLVHFFAEAAPAHWGRARGDDDPGRVASMQRAEHDLALGAIQHARLAPFRVAQPRRPRAARGALRLRGLPLPSRCRVAADARASAPAAEAPVVAVRGRGAIVDGVRAVASARGDRGTARHDRVVVRDIERVGGEGPLGGLPREPGRHRRHRVARRGLRGRGFRESR